MANEVTVYQGTPFGVLTNPQATQVISANLDGEKVSEFDLVTFRVPSGTGGGKWQADGEDAAVIEGLVSHIAKRRAYWPTSEPSSEPPQCSSRDLIRGAGDPGGECAVCPHNDYGSAEKGAGKACKESRAVFMFRPGDPLPVVVHVPPSGLRGLKRWLVGLRVHYYLTVARFALTKATNRQGTSYYQAQIECVAVLPEEAWEAATATHEAVQRSFE